MEKVYVKEKTIKAKNKIRKCAKISETFRKIYAPSNKIGNCTDLFRLHKPKDEEEFCEKYFKYAEEHQDLPISKRGLSLEEFKDLANRYMIVSNEISGKNYDYETYFNDLLCHVITETFDGKKCELAFTSFLERLGYKCDFFEGGIDGYYGIDIKVTRNSDGKESAIQIKPLSFFVSSRSDVVKDRLNLIYKYYHYLNDYGGKTYYAIYNKDTDGKVTWLKNGDGFRFRLKELFDFDDTDIAGTFVSKELPNVFEELPNN